MLKFLGLILTAGLGFPFAEPLFIIDQEAGRQVSSVNGKAYRSLMKNKEAVVIRINEKGHRKDSVEIALRAQQRSRFSIRKSEKGWEGRGNNYSRFTLREEDGLFSGQIFHGGKSYRIVPIAPSVSVLVAFGDGDIECGTEDSLEMGVEGVRAYAR